MSLITFLASRGKIATFVGIKILENSRVTERLNLFKVIVLFIMQTAKAIFNIERQKNRE